MFSDNLLLYNYNSIIEMLLYDCILLIVLANVILELYILLENILLYDCIFDGNSCLIFIWLFHI